MTQHEVETKLTVSKEDFESLLQHGKVQDCINQLNVYFDQGHQLSSRASTFRIRLFGAGKPSVMTLKVPVQSENRDLDETRRTLEVEKELDSHNAEHPPKGLDVAQDLPSEFETELSKLNLSYLQRLGAMRTWRHLVQISSDVIIEADHVRLPSGEEFYEIEFESESPERHQEVLDTIRDLISSSVPSRCSKYERFVQSLQEERGDGRSKQADTNVQIQPYPQV